MRDDVDEVLWNLLTDDLLRVLLVPPRVPTDMRPTTPPPARKRGEA